MSFDRQNGGRVQTMKYVVSLLHEIINLCMFYNLETRYQLLGYASSHETYLVDNRNEVGLVSETAPKREGVALLKY